MSLCNALSRYLARSFKRIHPPASRKIAFLVLYDSTILCAFSTSPFVTNPINLASDGSLQRSVFVFLSKWIVGSIGTLTPKPSSISLSDSGFALSVGISGGRSCNLRGFLLLSCTMSLFQFIIDLIFVVWLSALSLFYFRTKAEKAQPIPQEIEELPPMKPTIVDDVHSYEYEQSQIDNRE